ncbi:DUF4365 domain-containing protein [Cellulosimicrobium funkei]|uniref:DUF4365 domain-containing protein n=1 Tax=Cellulosimicrobium funkei TaxID=264251 RepID=UPI00142EA142|nr:DUF4365 domain-containing protein [Cellulosimicrobium funkei]
MEDPVADKSKKSRKKSKARTKQRQSKHVAADIGVEIVRRKLPLQWVARPINPDYGLDLHVEVFEPDDDDPTSGNTLGEHLYVQVKATKSVELKRVTVRSRRNVAKCEPETQSGEPIEIEVAKFALDTETLLTVEAMGAAVPVLLCYVDLSAEKVYYVCLNDYITKALLPYKPTYEGQGSVTIMIPSWNVLDCTDPSITYLWLLARRGKYYAAFNMFGYQYNELMWAQSEHPNLVHEDHPEMVLPAAEMLTMARSFLRSALRLSIWGPAGPGYWAPLGDVQKHLLFLQEHLPPAGRLLPAVEVAQYQHYLLDGFRRAANLGRMYEELVREWRMPTALAALLDFDEGNKYNPPDYAP